MASASAADIRGELSGHSTLIQEETPDKYEYRPLKNYRVSLAGETSFVFQVRAKNDAHVALYQHDGDTSRDMYEIVIGAGGNTYSEIRRSKLKDAAITTHHIPLCEKEFRPFWISWDDGVVAVGSGNDVGSKVFMKWEDPEPHIINHIAISTGWGATGTWLFDNRTYIQEETPDRYEYKPLDKCGIKLEHGQTSFVFQVRAKSNAHLALYEHEEDTDRDLYEIVLGAGDNTYSEIRRSKLKDAVSSQHHKPLSEEQFRPFWIKWDAGVVEVGKGNNVGAKTFLKWVDRQPHTVNHIAISTGWGATGVWLFDNRTFIQEETSDRYEYKPLDKCRVKLEPGQTSFVFQVRAKSNAHLALYEHEEDTDRDLYEIVLGAGNNTYSEIRRSKLKDAVSSQNHKALSEKKFRPFWIKWDAGVVEVGKGNNVGSQTFLKWVDPQPHNVNHIAISTGWGATGVWRFERRTVIQEETPDQYQYRQLGFYGTKLSGQTSFVFQVRAKSDAHLALYEHAGDTSRDMYEIVLGAGKNTYSEIRRSKLKDAVRSLNHKPLTDKEFRTFWISWEDGKVAVGSGKTVGCKSFLKWTDTQPHVVNYIAVSTGWGATGVWLFGKKCG